VGGTQRNQGQRHRMAHRQKWRCFFCGIKMVSAGTKIAGSKKLDPRSATFEHWDSRLDAERGKHYGEFRNVASCWKCNNERNAERQRRVPQEELWARSGSYPSSATSNT